MSINLLNIQERLEKIAPLLDLDAKRSELLELEQKALNGNLWDDPDQARFVLSTIESLKNILKRFDDLSQLISDPSILELLDEQEIEDQIKEFEQLAALSGEHDRQGAILTIHAGTGGVDAQDWAMMLERMYLRYIEKGSTEAVNERTFSIKRTDWQVSLLERNMGEEAGIKKVSLEISGNYAFGLLKSEAGVHRLVRLSPFNAKNLRQTSFALIEVIPEIERVGEVEINEKDLKIDVFRAGGHGGQGVNTTDSAVRITHLPSGIVVNVQNERSQHQNKATAMKILASKLARLNEVQNAEETAILKGEFKEGSWGNQIRSYVLQPYQMVKDHRTEAESSNPQNVLDGNLKEFIEAYLTQK